MKSGVASTFLLFFHRSQRGRSKPKHGPPGEGSGEELGGDFLQTRNLRWPSYALAVPIERPWMSPVALLLGIGSSFLNPRRLLRTAIMLRPTTLLCFHRGLRNIKYRFLYCSRPQLAPAGVSPPRSAMITRPSHPLPRQVFHLKDRRLRIGNRLSRAACTERCTGEP